MGDHADQVCVRRKLPQVMLHHRLRLRENKTTLIRDSATASEKSFVLTVGGRRGSRSIAG